MQTFGNLYCLYEIPVVRDDLPQLFNTALIRSCGEPGKDKLADAEQVTAIQGTGWLN